MRNSLFLLSLSLCLPFASAALAWAYWESWGEPSTETVWNGQYDTVLYAFVTVLDDGSLKKDDTSLGTFKQFITDNQLQSMVSIGGWNNSPHFRYAVRHLDKLVSEIKALVTQYSFGGVDIDWEYPGKNRGRCLADADEMNLFLAFLTRLKNELPPDKKITVAAPIDPASWAGMAHAEVAAKLDFLILMGYDINVATDEHKNVGPNAPLSTQAGCPPQPITVEAGVNAWMNHNIPASKLILGVPAYGRRYTIDDMQFQRPGPDGRWTMYPNWVSIPKGSALDILDTEPHDGNCDEPTNRFSGVSSYKHLFGDGPSIPAKLTADDVPVLGTEFHWDACSQTPLLYTPQEPAGQGTIITYDNPRSFRLKGDLTKRYGMAGYAVWNAKGDHNFALAKAIREGAAGLNM